MSKPTLIGSHRNKTYQAPIAQIIHTAMVENAAGAAFSLYLVINRIAAIA